MVSDSNETITTSETKSPPLRGTVKWFDDRKGFGFIIDSQGNDIFVHFSEICDDGYRTLKDGSEVQYQAVNGEKGWYATNVIPIDLPTKKTKKHNHNSTQPPAIQ